MIPSNLALPREELRDFLQSMGRITGLSFSYLPARSDLQDLIIGESAFCLQLKASVEGARRCQDSILGLRSRAVQSRKPEFDLCHARMAEVAVPLVSRDGEDMGTVMVGHAVIEGLAEEHREHIRALAAELDPGEESRYLAAAASSPVWTRSRLESLTGFIQKQLEEKAATRGSIEDTTEYLLEKYEELMFLYAITESLDPQAGHQRALAVILDKGAQKLSAQWGLLVLREEPGGGSLEMVDVCGTPPWTRVSDGLPVLSSLLPPCSGPAHFPGPVFPGAPGEEASGDLLVVPFRLRNHRQGYILFGWKERGAAGEGELRFVQALARQASSVLYAVHLYTELADLLFSTLGALSSAVDAKDPYTHGHSRRVAEYAVMSAREMGFDSRFLTMLKIAGQLHDFGKIGIREHILTKQGRLDEKEKESMNEHPVIGAQILARFKSFADIVPGIRHHHEHYDGTGYPAGLEGEGIPLVGRIIAVADAYDAMTTNRPYRMKLNHAQALVELRENAGRQFDPAVVKAFIRALEEKPSVQAGP